jgi:GNAT superfamily N-acetyltransferase
MINIERINKSNEKREQCTRLAAELPKWFGRPEANAMYSHKITAHECYSVKSNGNLAGLIALDFRIAATCNVWWLAVSPQFHRQGVGRALIERALNEARGRRCSHMAVETVSSKAENLEYELTRRFYLALGFKPFVEFEPEPGDYMMWMVREI